MRITTWNVNGLRSAVRKGFHRHLEAIAPDVLLLQEIRVHPDQLSAEWREPDGWYVHWNPARRPGYSGTAVWSRRPIESVVRGLSPADDDTEGRLMETRIGGLRVACVYLPSGSSGPHRQLVKDHFLRRMSKWARERAGGEPMVFGGDLNVAHTEADIYYAKANAETSGFLPHERAWFGRLLKSGWHDLVREHHGAVDGPYSWWSNRGRARELDRGWRIDYLLCNSAVRPSIRGATIHRSGGLEISDHAPVSVDLDI